MGIKSEKNIERSKFNLNGKAKKNKTKKNKPSNESLLIKYAKLKKY